MNQPQNRCAWIKPYDSLYINYHDQEWGCYENNDARCFEFILLESFQAGLSWYSVLKKRDNFSKAFANFNPEIIARMTDKEQLKLMENPGIIRNKLKIESAVTNAQKFLDFKEKNNQSFTEFILSFVGDKPRINHWKSIKEIPAITEESIRLSKYLKTMGFKFLGPTVCYSHMQAIGIVMDHETNCFRYKELSD